jgi:hypothetical protein
VRLTLSRKMFHLEAARLRLRLFCHLTCSHGFCFLSCCNFAAALRFLRLGPPLHLHAMGGALLLLQFLAGAR